MSLLLTIYACFDTVAATPAGQPASSTTPDKITALTMTPHGQEATFKYADVSYKTTLPDIQVHKKMYAPGEIIATVQIAPSEVTVDQGTDKSWYMFKQSVLEHAFKGRQVDLKEGDNEVAVGYYVHELVPQYKKDSLYLTLKIYSPDKLLTIDSYCRSFVAKRLFTDVMKGEMANFKIPYPGSDGKQATVASLLQMQTLNTLGSSEKEQILPYLVQFNEPLHNLLVRTANRWGELFYYENGKLNFGYNSSAASKELSISDTVSLSYQNLQTDSPVDVTLLSHDTKNPATFSPAFAADSGKPKGKFVDETTTEEYRGKFKNEENYYDQVVGQILSPSSWVYGWKKIGQLFTSAGTLFDWLITFIVDDMIAWKQADLKSASKNESYKDNYFKSDDAAAGRHKEQYDKDDATSATRFYPFATDHAPGVTTGPSSTTYNTVVANERHAGKDLMVIDFGANYKHLSLGDIFTFEGDGSKAQYMVIAVDSSTVSHRSLGVSNGKPVEKITKAQEFQVTAVKKQTGGWYPPMHEAGHVRLSEPQVAFIADTDDPTRNRRYRVRYTWQAEEDLASPWLAVANPASTDGGGAFFLHQKNDEVLLNYEGGNIERPYIVGALQKQTPDDDKEATVHLSTRTNYAVLSTPAGHRITMTDGGGYGVVSFLANMFPIVNLVKGFAPNKFAKPDDAESKKYEGNIEITDANGLFSIKGSTDERNVTIKSVFGDVKINAFTGITVSAPNGDVKIQGKNVSIEAGNNLTLKSGANIASGFMGKVHLGKFTAADVGKAAFEATAKYAINKVMSYLDLSLMRHVMETFLRPIEGTLEVKSNRYLKLESGKGEAAVPVTAYQRTYAEKKTETSVPKGVFDTFNLVETIAGNLVHRIRSIHDRCNSCFESYQNLSAQYPDSCISATDLVGVLYGKDNENDVKDADLQFKGVLGVEDADIDSAVLKKSVVRRANESDENYKKRIKTFRNHTRNSLKRKAKLLAGNILAMKAFIGGAAIAYAVQAREGCDTTKLNAAISKANCLDDGNQGMLHQLRNNLAQVINNPVDDNTYAPTKTRLKRVIFMNLVKEYNLPRQAIGDLKQVPPEPAVNVSVIDAVQWTTYVDSVLCELDPEKEKPGLMGTLGKTALDSIKKNVCFWSNLADHKVWGPEKNGAILFSSGPATHVLGKEIYRANVDFSSTVKYGEDPNDAHTGYTDLLHEIMKG